MNKNQSQPAVNQRRAWTMWLVNIGLLAIVVATALPLLHVGVDVSRFVYAAGAVVLLAGRVLTPATGNVSLRLKRMCRLETWSAIIFIVGAGLLFYPGTAGTGGWIAGARAGGAVLV